MHKFIPAIVFLWLLALATLIACSSAKNMSLDSSAAIPTTVPESHSSAAIPDGACAACTADTASTEQSRSEQRRSMPESDSSAVIPDPVPGSASADFFRDFRDGQVYKMVTIGNQVWMAKNLNYEMAGSYCYSNNASNCMRYGRLYTWNAAMNACPDGWHLPTYDELVSLIENASGQFLAGGVLKSKGGWKKCRHCDIADDMYGFSALPTGVMNEDGSFDKIFEYVFLWSATETESNQIPYMGFANVSSVAMLLLGNKNKGFSVRCVKGTPSKSEGPLKMNDLDRPGIKFYDLPLTANTPTLNDEETKIWLDEF